MGGFQSFGQNYDVNLLDTKSDQVVKVEGASFEFTSTTNACTNITENKVFALVCGISRVPKLVEYTKGALKCNVI